MCINTFFFFFFLGKRIVQLQASLALVQGTNSKSSVAPDEFGRQPFTHEALDGLNNLSPQLKKRLTHRVQLANLADSYEAQKVLRWTPRKVRIVKKKKKKKIGLLPFLLSFY